MTEQHGREADRLIAKLIAETGRITSEPDECVFAKAMIPMIVTSATTLAILVVAKHFL